MKETSEGELLNEPTIAPREGFTLREAVVRTGLSERTLREWIKRGKIESWETAGRYGREWRVVIPAELFVTGLSTDKPASGTVPEEPSVPLATYQDLLLRHENAVHRLGYLQSQSDLIQSLTSEAERLRTEKAEALAQTTTALNALHRLNQELESLRLRDQEHSEASSFYREIMAEMKERALKSEQESATLRNQLETVDSDSSRTSPRKAGLSRWVRQQPNRSFQG